ncbi:MAG: AAA family ATPase, partial [Bacteroidales bacterium]|nr:AAA family ATPase [Bacteroidales bacterium]MDR1758424.1 AAA family ATPase [Bacteroidales bacterium]
MTPQKRLYPIGTQDFRNLRQGGFIYVDKTHFIHK